MRAKKKGFGNMLPTTKGSDKDLITGATHSNTGFFLIISLFCVLVFTGCAPMDIKTIYPAQIAPLAVAQPDDLSDNYVEVNVKASTERTWEALVTVLAQHAFFTHVDGTSDTERKLAYVDRLTVKLAGRMVDIELPFQVTVSAAEENTTQVKVFCRWDLITTMDYRENKKQSYEDLKNSMMTEAYILADRVANQARPSSYWQQLKEANKR